MKKVMLGGLALAALAAVPVLAQTMGDAPARHRGARPITRTVFLKHVEDRFSRLDANHDGYIDRSEAGAPPEMAAGPRGPRGRGDPNASFDRMDANHDGSISRSEYLAYRSRGPRARGGGFGSSGSGRPRRASLGWGFTGRWFDRVDADRDGRISLAEAQRAATSLFDRLDTNRDGVLSPEERSAARQGFRLRRMAPEDRGE